MRLSANERDFLLRVRFAEMMRTIGRGSERPDPHEWADMQRAKLNPRATGAKLLARLRRRGLVEWQNGAVLTPAGRAALGTSPPCPDCGGPMHRCKTGDPGCWHCDSATCAGERPPKACVKCGEVVDRPMLKGPERCESCED